MQEVGSSSLPWPRFLAGGLRTIRSTLGTLLHTEALLAQMVERWPFKPMVVGSIPTEGVGFKLGRHSIVVIAPAS